MKPNKQLTTNFKWGEFWSNSTSGVKVEPPKEMFNSILKMAKELQIVRTMLNTPIIIRSGYRTKEWNKFVGGAKRSYHLKGMAVDSYAVNVSIVRYVVYLAYCTSFNGFGIYVDKNFVHSDMREKFIVFKS